MSEDYRAKIAELLEFSRENGNGQDGLAAAEEAARLADAHDDEERGFEARERIMDAAVWIGSYDRLLVAFSWYLARADQKSDFFDVVQLLWKYKWVIEHLVHFPGISREQIQGALEDFRARCQKAGFNDRSALFLRWVLEMQMGNVIGADEWHRQWKLTRRDGMSDCRACEANRVAELLAARDDHEAAVNAADPILNRRMTCGEIPHLTYATLLRSAWHLNRREEAESWHNTGYRLVRGNRDFIREQSWHVMHLLRSKQLERALPLVRKHLPWAMESSALDHRFYFLVAAASTTRCLLANGTRSMRISLRETVCPIAGKTTVQVEKLDEWMRSQVADLSMKFDRRNGNQWFTQYARSAAADFDHG